MRSKPIDTSSPAANSPKAIIRQLLSDAGAPAPQPPTAITRRRVATLERQAPDMLARARRAGQQIEYLGINPLFSEPRLYPGVDTDWVLGPAGRDADAEVPRQERTVLEALHAAGLEFPLIYIAHETRRQAQASLIARNHGHAILDESEAEALIGPVPPPAASVVLGQRLADRSARVIKGVRETATAAGMVAAGIAAAPVALVAGAVMALATVDPIVIGAIPALSAASGQPAAWYVLARWDW